MLKNFQLDSRCRAFFSALNSDIKWERFFWVLVLVLSNFFSFLTGEQIDPGPWPVNSFSSELQPYKLPLTLL